MKKALNAAVIVGASVCVVLNVHYGDAFGAAVWTFILTANVVPIKAHPRRSGKNTHLTHGA